MTDDTHGAGSYEEPEATGGTPAEDMPAATNEFTSGEGLVAMAGILLLGVWLVFEVIIADYFVATLGVVLALAVVILPRINRESVESVHRLAVIMKVLGFALFLTGVTEVIDDIRFDAYDSLAGVLGALGAYAAYAMAFLGAKSIET